MCPRKRVKLDFNKNARFENTGPRPRGCDEVTPWCGRAPSWWGSRIRAQNRARALGVPSVREPDPSPPRHPGGSSWPAPSSRREDGCAGQGPRFLVSPETRWSLGPFRGSPTTSGTKTEVQKYQGSRRFTQNTHIPCPPDRAVCCFSGRKPRGTGVTEDSLTEGQGGRPVEQDSDFTFAVTPYKETPLGRAE